MTKIVFIAIVVIHGLIHLLGFLKAFELANISELTQSITRPLGIVWLTTALLLMTTAITFAIKIDWWWVIAIVAVVLSQILVITSWQDAKYGTIPNVLILGVVLLSLGSILFELGYRKDIQNSLIRTRSLPAEIVTEADIQPLPQAVQLYLNYVGVVGKPKVSSMRAVLTGEMREKGKDYFPFTAEQYNFYDEPIRLFFMKAQMFGMTVPGYHRYIDGRATMDVRIFGLFSVVKHAGEVMNVSDTVTLFNDMCLFAPAALIDKRIAWESVDELTAKATFTNHGISISATLYFNTEGQLVNFISEDRWAVADRKRYPFSTPVSNYRNINGYNLPTYGEAIWHFPDGKFVYGKIQIKDIEYNIRALK
jgi:hypothetical protein